MTPVSVIALILLIVRLIAVVFTIMVLRSQISLLKLKIEHELTGIRNVMLLLGYVLLIGSFLPIVIDFYYAFINVDAANSIIVYYAISNALSHLAAAVLLWNIYRIAQTDLGEREHEEDQRLVNKANKLINESNRVTNVVDRKLLADDRKAMEKERKDGVSTKRTRSGGTTKKSRAGSRKKASIPTRKR